MSCRACRHPVPGSHELGCVDRLTDRPGHRELQRLLEAQQAAAFGTQLGLYAKQQDVRTWGQVQR